jgi:uncharacterized damage-inducible protein DinB
MNFSLSTHWDFHIWRVNKLVAHLLSLDLSILPPVAPDLLLHHKNPVSKVEMYFWHLVLAEYVWKCRVEGKPFALPSEEVSLADACHMWQELNAFWKEKLGESEAKYAYATTSGEKFHSTIGETIVHLVDHATYHTGQIMATLKQYGLPTVSTVYIEFLRR